MKGYELLLLFLICDNIITINVIAKENFDGQRYEFKNSIFFK